jgi:hypothetical protein
MVDLVGGIAQLRFYGMETGYAHRGVYATWHELNFVSVSGWLLKRLGLGGQHGFAKLFEEVMRVLRTRRRFGMVLN